MYFNGTVTGIGYSVRHCGKKDRLELYGETNWGKENECIAIRAYLSFNVETQKDEIKVYLVNGGRFDRGTREVPLGIFTKDDLDKNLEVIRSENN